MEALAALPQTPLSIMAVLVPKTVHLHYKAMLCLHIGNDNGRNGPGSAM